MLVNSEPDDIALAENVRSNLVELNAMHMQYKGTSLSVPNSLASDMKQFDALCMRHLKGDYRHTSAERQSLKTIAQWSVDIVGSLRNQPAKKIEWKD